MSSATSRNHSQADRATVLVVDDDREIHADYDRIFRQDTASVDRLDDLEASLFAGPTSTSRQRAYELLHAHQGVEAIEVVRKKLAEGTRISVAFIDVLMPPGSDGVQTTTKLWAIDPAIQVVICTAYTEFSWKETVARLQRSDGLYLLRKPFDPDQIRAFADTLHTKWKRLCGQGAMGLKHA
ncbi:MAG: response regulator [Nannocystaceae bacterium]